jgi:hypothetical protein
LHVAAVGAFTGSTLCALDYGRSALSPLPLRLSWPEHLAHLTLMFVAGYLAGLLGSLVLSGCLQIARSVAARTRVSLRLMLSIVVALVCLIVIVPVAAALFQGRGIRHSNVARWGPVAVSVLAWIFCAVAAGAIQRMLQSATASRATLLGRAAWLGGLAVLLAPLIYFDLYTFHGLYSYLHGVLMALSFLVIALGWWLLLGRGRALCARLGVTLLVLCLPGLAFSSTRYDASLGAFATHFAYTSRVLLFSRWLTDWDGDGYSNLFGQKDAAILDRSIHPLAPEVPGNGVDEDGVFGDLNGAELDAARQKLSQGRAAAAPARAPAPSATAHPAHLLLITIDTLRADRILPDNDSDPPAFAAFKQASIRFARAFASSSYTENSVRMLMTGRYDVEQATTSLFDTLHGAGCTTLAAFAETPFEILSASHPNVLASFDTKRVVPDREPGDLAAFNAYAATRPTSKAIVTEALQLLQQNRQRPRTCTWVYLFDVHQWQQLQDPEVVGDGSSQGSERYDKAVAYAREQVSRLLEGLEQLGLADSTLVVLSGDHGEGLGEKGIVGHTRWVYNPLLHVPLIVRAPGIAPREVRDTEVGLIDVAPTILDLFEPQLRLPGLHGASLLPAMLGQPVEHVVFAHEESYDAVFAAHHKLVVDRTEGRYRLYDLESDPDETSSLFEVPGHESIAREMYSMYQVGPLGPGRQRSN